MSAPEFHWKSFCHSMAHLLSVTVLIVILALLLPVSSHSQSCLPEGITFTTQSQIDSFQINYPGCTEIEGDVLIKYPNSVSNLLGLNSITDIGGELLISACVGLTTLDGLNKLQNIGGALSIVDNDDLLSVFALQNLRTIGGGLTISWNSRIKSLSGIDSLDAMSIESLHMIYNDSLSWCAVESVCQYIGSTNASVSIQNAIGCNSIEVVAEYCSHVSIEEQLSVTQLSAYPNPFTTATTIEFSLDEKSKIQISIYNTMGELVFHTEDQFDLGTHMMSWSPHHLPTGLYYAVLRSEEGVSVVKMVKQ